MQFVFSQAVLKCENHNLNLYISHALFKMPRFADPISHIATRLLPSGYGYWLCIWISRSGYYFFLTKECAEYKIYLIF